MEIFQANLIMELTKLKMMLGVIDITAGTLQALMWPAAAVIIVRMWLNKSK